jgi:hypothetical protein
MTLERCNSKKDKVSKCASTSEQNTFFESLNYVVITQDTYIAFKNYENPIQSTFAMIGAAKMDSLKAGGDTSFWDVYKHGKAYHLEALVQPAEFENEDTLIEAFQNWGKEKEEHKFLKYTNVRGSQGLPKTVP